MWVNVLATQGTRIIHCAFKSKPYKNTHSYSFYILDELKGVLSNYIHEVFCIGHSLGQL